MGGAPVPEARQALAPGTGVGDHREGNRRDEQALFEAITAIAVTRYLGTLDDFHCYARTIEI